MIQTYKTTSNSTEEINPSIFDLSPTNYSIGIEDIKTLPCGGKQPQPIMKTREELRAVMGNDPFWTAAVQSLLKCGFWAIKEGADGAE